MGLYCQHVLWFYLLLSKSYFHAHLRAHPKRWQASVAGPPVTKMLLMLTITRSSKKFTESEYILVKMYVLFLPTARICIVFFYRCRVSYFKIMINLDWSHLYMSKDNGTFIICDNDTELSKQIVYWIQRYRSWKFPPFRNLCCTDFH